MDILDEIQEKRMNFLRHHPGMIDPNLMLLPQDRVREFMSALDKLAGGNYRNAHGFSYVNGYRFGIAYYGMEVAPSPTERIRIAFEVKEK